MIPLGGFLESGGVGLWGILAPLAALVFNDVRSAARWYVAYLIVFLGSGIAGEVIGPIWSPLPDWFTSAMLALNIAVGGTIVFTLLAVFARQRSDALAALRLEQAKAEELLLNILPREISEELKEKGKATARRHEEVTVVFTDMKGFTRIAEKMTPEQLVNDLDECFIRFDAIIDRYGIEKIKTIGDSYMCAGGVPTNDPYHAQKAVLAALEIRELMVLMAGEQTGQGREPWICRIGVHTGPVVAGVVGKRKFAYDIWGDAVNTASRMESHGTPGRIQITRATYELLADEFECEPRGPIAVKGKGEIEAWYLIRPRGDRGVSRSARETAQR